MREKTLLMDRAAMNRAMLRISHEIIERNHGVEDVVLIGIQRRGVPMAQVIAGNIGRVEGVEVPVGTLDITFYRDDLSLLNEQPKVNGTDVPFMVTGRHVVVVDDVLYTGRTAPVSYTHLDVYKRQANILLILHIKKTHHNLLILFFHYNRKSDAEGNKKFSLCSSFSFFFHLGGVG